MRYLPIILFVLTILQISPTFATDSMNLSSEDREQFTEIFSDWKKDQIAQLNYMEAKDCNPAFYLDNFIKDKYHPDVYLGFPKKTEAIIPIYANSDDTLDFVVTFRAKQCDGGSAMAGFQEKILFLSNNNGHLADSDFLSNNIQESPLPLSWASHYLAGSTGDTKLTGKAILTLRGDSRCCPSLKSYFTFDFKTGKTAFEKPVENY